MIPVAFDEARIAVRAVGALRFCPVAVTDIGITETGTQGDVSRAKEGRHRSCGFILQFIVGVKRTEVDGNIGGEFGDYPVAHAL